MSEKISGSSVERQEGEYSNEEVLGLDEPKYELVGRGQSVLVPRVAHDLYRPENQTAEKMSKLLHKIIVKAGGTIRCIK